MAEESTRRLLKVFGIAVTDLEEIVQSLLASLEGAGKDPAAVIPLLEQYLKASGALMKHWAQVGQLLSETHERATSRLLQTLEKLK